MNKIIIAIAVVVVVIVGGYFLGRGVLRSTPSASEPSTSQQPSQQSPESQTPAINENVVIYTDSGYSQSTLTIQKGETVTFKNQSSRSMWTASGVHPSHTLYPTTGGCLGSTFDACSGIQPGDSWSFKFDVSGTWKYHNHLRPGDTGTIVVQ